MINRTSIGNRYNRITPVARINPMYTYRDTMETDQDRYAMENSSKPSAPESASVPSSIQRAAEAASSIVQQALQVRYAVDKVNTSPSYDAMIELQDQAERLTERLQSESELQLDPDLGDRLTAAYSPVGWRDIAEPFAEQPPQRMIPIREAIYNDQFQIQSLYPDKGLLLAAQA